MGEVSKKEINDIFGGKMERKAVDFALLGPKVHLLGGKGKVRKKRNQKSAKRDKRTLSVCVAKGEANGVRENILFRRQMKRGV